MINVAAPVINVAAPDQVMTPQQVDTLLEQLGRDPAMANALRTGLVTRADLVSQNPARRAQAKQTLYKLLARQQQSQSSKSYAAAYQKPRHYRASTSTTSRVPWASYHRPRLLRA